MHVLWLAVPSFGAVALKEVKPTIMAHDSDQGLFPDEQAYIAHKRHLVEIQRAEELKRAQARQKRRRVKYSDRIRRALRTIASQQRWAAIRANPERYASYRRQCRRYEEAKRRDPVRYARQLEAQRRHYERHREEVRLRVAAYKRDHLEQKRAYNRVYNTAYSRELRRARNEQCDEGTARERARLAAKAATRNVVQKERREER